MDAFHAGRAWTARTLEANCPCPKEPCGLVNIFAADPACPEHAPERAKAMRQGHAGERCPGKPQ